jgi:geranyl-CoA carboxylase alpha subunit
VGAVTKLLVANRGEIACRIIRTARAMGIRTVAVYADADRGAPHVALADEAVWLGGSPASESYLRGERLLACAAQVGADALHPGYGFLSENAAFADAVASAGLTFVGPPGDAIRAMGDKAGAKRRMAAAGVPVSPGYSGDDQSDARFLAEAERVGFPLMVKATAGGGGRGIRVVGSAAELPAALESARREATSAFGDGTLLLERRIVDGRHVEVQVFADAHGNVVHLGERDCTAQRRRQKVIEEAPSPIVDAALRARMGEAAVSAARAVGYRGAGTIEFMVDGSGAFWFLEMNTRLQVEHPVTELVTGLDLVRWQLLVAQGEPLPLRQDQVTLDGHAIEARLYAEDPYDGFRPSIGPVTRFAPERLAGRPGVRVDAGVASGGEVSPFYDAMVAKVIAHGATRAEAIAKLVQALDDAPLVGLAANGRFLRDLVTHPDFVGARMTTTRIDAWGESGEPILARPTPSEHTWRVAAALAARGAGDGFRSLGASRFSLTIAGEGARRTFAVRHGSAAEQAEAQATWGPGYVRVDLEHGGATHTVLVGPGDADGFVVVDDGVRRAALATRAADGAWWITERAHGFRFVEPSPLARRAAADDPRRVLAPLAGVVARVLVEVGQAVEAGQPLAIVEAMKMETRVPARAAGKVVAVHARVGEQVTSGRPLFELEPS